jgi:hypothetical protein
MKMTLKKILQRQIDRLNNMIKTNSDTEVINRLQEMVILRFERLNEKELQHD